MIKLQLIICTLFLASCSLCAQSGAVASGGNATGTGGSVSYSVGQVDYINSSSSSGNVNQGIQQPYEIFTMGVDDQENNAGISVYPNPTAHLVYIQFTELPNDCFYQLHNSLGQQVATSVITENPTGIYMENLATGTYHLNLIKNQTTLQTFTIIKK